jgi:hypothetical protein
MSIACVSGAIDLFPERRVHRRCRAVLRVEQYEAIDRFAGCSFKKSIIDA